MAKRLDITDLNIYYGDFLAVEGVSMAVEPRAVTAFIGPSGCGKSTVIRSLNRMHEVDPRSAHRGRIALDGEDLYGSDGRPGAGAAQHRHGVPAAEPVPDDVRSTRT